MYQRITEITDKLFQDIEMTEEAQVLKEELTADLNDRYADLLTSGVSEEDAVRQIQEDLDGFSELTRRFPHRQRSVVPVAPGSIPAANITQISVRLGSDDIQVISSEDQQIHLELSGNPKAHWHSEQNGGRLSLEIVHPEEEPQNTRIPESQYSESLSGWLLRTLKIIAVHIETHESCHGTIRVPASWRKEMEVFSGSGDIEISLPLEKLSIRTGSGDINACAFEGCRTLRISTASGDVNVRGIAENAEVTATSGDIDLEGEFASLRVSTTSGDADLTRFKAGTLTLQTTSGDIDVRGEAHEIVFNAVSGDITMELTGALRRLKGNTVSGDTEIILADRQPAVVQTNTVSGSIRTNCQNGPDPAAIKLNSVSGDIQVS